MSRQSASMRDRASAWVNPPRVAPRAARPLRRLILVSVLILLLVSCTPETSSGAQMAAANQLYEAGQFGEAAEAYLALIDGGVEEGVLYYNLGNAYFKAGDLGRAIANYRRAQRLLPRDPDVAANLGLARAQAVDRLEIEHRGALVDIARQVLVEWTRLDEAATIALALWSLLGVLVVAVILAPRARPTLRYGITATTILLALTVLSIGLRLASEHGRTPAVIVAESVDTHSGPGEDYLAEFSLHAGAEVRVLEERNGWVRITLPGDLQGWVRGEAVEEIR